MDDSRGAAALDQAVIGPSFTRGWASLTSYSTLKEDTSLQPNYQQKGSSSRLLLIQCLLQPMPPLKRAALP